MRELSQAEELRFDPERKERKKKKDGGRCGEVASLPHFREQDVVFLAIAHVLRLCLCTVCTSLTLKMTPALPPL